MARCTIQPGAALSGRIRPPPSYGHALRLVWGACLGAGGTIGNCPDRPAVRALFEAGRSFGAEPVLEGNVADIFGPGGPYPPDFMPCQSNTYATRFALPLATLFGTSTTLTGTQLPFAASHWLDSASKELELRITHVGERITVQGPPKAEGIQLSDRPGAFWAPGWLMALPLSDQPLVLGMDDFVASHPAVGMTLAALDQFGISYSKDLSDSTLTIAPQQEYVAADVEVENDWRAGSYLLGALLLAGNGEVEVSSFSGQPERAFWKTLEEWHLLTFSADGLCASPQGHHALDLPDTLDLRPYPALLPLAMVLATQSAHPLRITPLTPLSPRSLRRARLMEAALAYLGAQVVVNESWIEVTPSPLSGGTVDCGGDARVAMALGLAGLVASGPVVIEDAQAVSTVYAGFWADLRRLGANATLTFERPSNTARAPAQEPKNPPPPAASPTPSRPSGPIVPLSPPPASARPAAKDDDWHPL